MVQKTNYLLGYGERLMEPITAPKKLGKKSHIYTFGEAKEAVRSMAIEAVRVLDELPPAACPDDEAVALLTLHPTYIAKSHYPTELFQTVGLHPIGSRQRAIAPKKWESETESKKKRVNRIQKPLSRLKSLWQVQEMCSVAGQVLLIYGQKNLAGRMICLK